MCDSLHDRNPAKHLLSPRSDPKKKKSLETEGLRVCKGREAASSREDWWRQGDFSRQDFVLNSCEQKKKATRKKGIKENIWRNKTLQPPSLQQVWFVCLVQMEIFAFEMHLQMAQCICRQIKLVLSGQKQSPKIASCVRFYFAVVASKESALGTGLPGKRQAGGGALLGPVSCLWGPAPVDGD